MINVDTLTDDLQTGDFAESLARLREGSVRWARRERMRERCTSGLPTLDALLGGGWPEGKVAELIGPHSSGRTAAAMMTAAAATGRGELVAWLDGADAFDPTSAEAAGVDLARVLWVRPRGVDETVRAAEMVLELCGFKVVVVDLAGAVAPSLSAATGAARGRRGGERRASLKLRLARTVERVGAVAIVLAERSWMGTSAGVTVALGHGEPRWAGGEGSPRWLEGITLRPRVERGGVRRGGDREAPVLAWKGQAVGG